MPKLNRKKLPYIKVKYKISDPSENPHGFYNIADSATSPKNNVPGSLFRGYDTYDGFGPTVRRHEPKDDVENNEDELSL